MVNDVYDKQGNETDERAPEFVPDETDPDLEAAYNAPAYGEGSGSALSDSDLSAKETTTAAKKEDDEPEEEEKGYFNDEDDKKGKKRGVRGMSRKQGGIMGIIGAAIMTALIAVVMQGPNVIVNNIKEMLVGRIGTIQQYHQRRYRQSKFARTKNLFSRQGRLGQSIIDEMNGKGYTFHFDPNDKNKIIGITLPDGKNTAVLDGIGEHLDDYMEKQHPFRSARWKTKRMEAFYKKFGVSRKSVIDAVPNREGPDEPAKIVNKEMADQVVEDEPSDVSTESKTSEGTDEQKAETDAENAKNQSVDGVGGELADEFEEGTAELTEEGTDISQVQNALVRNSDEIAEGMGENVLNLAEEAAKGSLGGRAFDAVKGFFSPTDIVDKVCTLRNRLRMAQMAGRSIKAIKLMRYAGTFINAADATRTGKADPKLLNELMKRVMANDSTGNPIGASPGFGYLLKSKFSKSRNSTTRNKVAVDGELTGVYGGIKDSTDQLLSIGNVGSKCWLFQNPAFQIATGAADLVVKAVGCVFTGCSTAAGEEAAVEAAEQAVTITVKNLIKEKMEQVFTKAAIKKLAIGATGSLAINLSFEGAMMLVQMYAAQTMHLPFNGQEKGAGLGDILTGGGGVLNKQRSQQAGMVPSTTRQYAAAQEEYIAWKTEKTKSQSFATRIFDMNNIDSLAFRTVSAAIPTGSAGVSGGVTNITNMASSLLSGGPLSMALNLFGSSASADDDEVSMAAYTVKDANGNDTDTELATDFAGNPQVIIRDDIEAVDPDENIPYLTDSGDIDATTLEPKSDAFKKHIEDCVDNPDVLSKIEFEGDSTDCMAKQNITVRYKAHLAYLDMEDSLQAEFQPELLASTGGGSTSTGNPTGVAPTTTDIATLYEPSENIACAEGTRDLGVHDGYHAGTLIRIRLCSIDAIPSNTVPENTVPNQNGKLAVNSRMSAVYLKLAQDATAARIPLAANEGFRTMARQEYFWNCYQTKACNNGNKAAEPGRSNHQAGVAVDWAPSVYNWLNAGAANTYGLKVCGCNESWHYSPDGG